MCDFEAFSVLVNICNVSVLADGTIVLIHRANVLVKMLLNICLYVQAHVYWFSHAIAISVVRFAVFFDIGTSVSCWIARSKIFFSFFPISFISLRLRTYVLWVIIILLLFPLFRTFRLHDWSFASILALI